jgi:hypothetical protein
MMRNGELSGALDTALYASICVFVRVRARVLLHSLTRVVLGVVDKKGVEERHTERNRREEQQQQR